MKVSQDDPSPTRPLNLSLESAERKDSQEEGHQNRINLPVINHSSSPSRAS